jgi:cell division protein FtsQ
MRRLTSKQRPCPPPPERSSGRKTRQPVRSPHKRRRARARIDPRIAAAGAIVAILTLVLGSFGWLWSNGWIERQTAAQTAALAAGFYRLTAESGLVVEEVLVEGRHRTARGSLLAALEVGRGDPILAFDPGAARRRLEALPWVRRAAVERRLPSVIYLHLEERRPLAVWQLEGRLAVIDETGETIAGARPEDFTDLTLVVGPDAPAHSAVLLEMLDGEPDLKRRVSAAVRVGGRRWNLRLDGAIDVRLPESGAAEAWARLARIERRHGVLDRDVATIDLRMPDRLVVRTLSGAIRSAESIAGKNT